MRVPSPARSELVLLQHLRRRRSDILSSWAEGAREVAGRGDISGVQMIDHIPELLDELVDALQAAKGGRGREVQLSQTTAERHAVDRLKDGFDLNQVVGELSLLREVILDTCDRAGVIIRDRDRRILNRAIDRAIAASVERYTSTQQRTLRGLDRISAAALDATTIDELLQRLVEVFLQSMPAVDTASILLREGDRLVVRAAAGLESEARGRVSLRVGEGFAGTIAASRQPLLARPGNAEPTVEKEAEATRALRVRYGVPLIDGGALIGVAQMGSLTAHEFSEQDRQVFTSMVARATAAIHYHALRADAERHARRLAESEERFRLLVDSVQDYALVLLDPDGYVVSWNVGGERTTQFGADEIVGRHFSQFYDPADIARGKPGTELRIAAALGRYTEEGWRRRKDGSLFWAGVTITPIWDEAGRLRGFAKVMHDLSERRRTEEALRKHEEHLRLAMEAASLGSYEWNLQTGTVAWSDATRRMIGAPEGLPPSLQTLYKAVDARDRSHLREQTRLAVERKRPFYEVEFRVSPAGGAERWVASYSGVQLDAAGRPVRVLGVVQDITDRKRTEMALRFLGEASSLLSQSLDFETTLERVARLAVPALADWCMVDLLEGDELSLVVVAHVDPEKERLVRELRKRYPPERGLLRGLWQVIRTGKPDFAANITTELLQKAGYDEEQIRITHDLQMRSALMVPLAARGRTFGAMTMIGAESGRSYDEQDLATMRQLGERAALAIDNARLYSEVQRAVAMREQMLAVVSHDLRNPLGVVRMGADILLEQAGEPKWQKQLEAISRAATRMEHLIRDLLDLASIQAGKLSTARRPQPVRPLLVEACDSHESLAKEKGIRVEVGTTCDGVEAFCDRERVLQVLSNLIGNAIKFCPTGAHVHLEALAEPDEVLIRVRDDGPGIAPEQLPRIFEPYWTTGRVRQGTGLGLFISRGIVEAHGGRIGVRSRLGEGATFEFTLPRANGFNRSGSPAGSGPDGQCS